MTVEEFRKTIREEREKGTSDEDILSVFAAMYCDGKIQRGLLEMIAGELGWDFTDKAKAMDDEEFKDSLFEKSEDEVEEGKDPEEEKVDPFGDKPPVAKKGEVKEEEKSESEEEEDDDDSERKEAERLFGMKFSKK